MCFFLFVGFICKFTYYNMWDIRIRKGIFKNMRFNGREEKDREVCVICMKIGKKELVSWE